MLNDNLYPSQAINTKLVLKSALKFDTICVKLAIGY